MDVFLPIAHMDVNIVLILTYGAVVGFLSGLLGVGGGFLITPLLIFTGVPPIVAVSSGAAQMAGTAAGASLLHWRHRNIDFKLGLVLLLGSGTGALAGVKLASLLLHAGTFGNVVALLYVMLLGTVGATMLVESARAMRDKSRASGARDAADAATPRGLARLLRRWPLQTTFPASGLRTSALAPFALGLAIGLLTSLMGVGGGFIMVPAMVYFLRVPLMTVVGTSLFQLLFTTAAVSVMQAGINHAVDPVLALLLILGSVLGTRLGANLGKRLPEERMRLIFALLVLAVALRMLSEMTGQPSELYSMSLERY